MLNGTIKYSFKLVIDNKQLRKSYQLHSNYQKFYKKNKNSAFRIISFSKHSQNHNFFILIIPWFLSATKREIDFFELYFLVTFLIILIYFTFSVIYFIVIYEYSNFATRYEQIKYADPRRSFEFGHGGQWHDFFVFQRLGTGSN